MIESRYFEELLREKRYKLTTQRKTVLQVFIDCSERHLSAEDVHMLLRERASSVGLATVYRTLDLLAGLELLERMDLGDGRLRYEIKQPRRAIRHHHLICMDCGAVHEVIGSAMDGVLSAIEADTGYVIVDHQMKFYGYCNECRMHDKNR